MIKKGKHKPMVVSPVLHLKEKDATKEKKK